MLPADNNLRANFIVVLKEITALMSIAHEQTGPVPDDHPLAQAGLENGGEIVLDYVDHNEAGLAFEHLLYMINEPPSLFPKNVQTSWPTSQRFWRCRLKGAKAAKYERPLSANRRRS